MSELLLSWLNDEVQLSKKITSFDSDFANGYYFGELLSKFNQQLNFSEFDNRDLRASKIKNFTLLEPTFKILRINCDTIIVDNIINQKPGVAECMLYELRMALEKVNNPADALILHKTGKFNPVYPLKRLEPGKLQFDTFESRFFGRRLNEMNKAQKTVNLEKHLKPFRDFQTLQEEILRKRRQEDLIKEQKIKDEMRKISLNKLQRNMAFLENWNEKGKENWEKNQKIMKERVIKEEEFRAKTLEHKSVRLQAIHEQNKKEIYEGIEQFESNLKKHGIESPESLEKKALSLDKSHTMFSASATMLRIKEKKMVSDFMRKERDKRRRKMIVDQAKAQREIEVKKREELLIEKLNQESRQEKELSYEIWRAGQCKEIIKENRILREEKYKQKREQCVLSSKYKEEEMLAILQQEFLVDLEAKKLRLSELQVQHKKEIRKKHYDLMRDVVCNIFEMSELLYLHQQDQDSEDFSPAFFTEITRLFTNDQPLIPYSTTREPLGIQALTQEPSNQVKNSMDFLAKQELNDYIQGKGVWTPVHKGENPENPELDDKYTPGNPLNNYYLGNLVKFLIFSVYNKENLNGNTATEAKNTNYLPLKLALLGYDFAGKRNLLTFIQKKYGLEAIFMENLLEEALEKASEFLQKTVEDPTDFTVLPKSPYEREYLDLCLEIRKAISIGKALDDVFYIKLLLLRIKKLFPAMSYEEFVQFYQELPSFGESTNKKPADHPSLTKRDSAMGPAPLTKEEIFIEKLMSHQHKFTKGWVLYDFPHTYNQAKLLERFLTGFVPKDERIVSVYEEKLAISSLIVQPTATRIIPKKLKPSGLDCALYLRTSKEECLRRALGRKVDPITKVLFHLDDTIPPTDNAPLIERLESIRDVKANELVLVDKLNACDIHDQDLCDWYNLFGFQQMNFKCLQEIHTAKDPVLTFEKVSECLESVLQSKEQEIQSFLQEKQREKEDREREIEENKAREEKEKELSLIDFEELKNDLLKYQKKVQDLTPKDALKDEHIKFLLNLWENTQNYYLEQTKQVFQNMRKQRELISMRLAEIQRHFLYLLQRKDQKFAFLLDFQEKYNSFLQANPDMIEDPQTKEEMHQRVEDLHDVLFDLIESKREEMLEERKSIISSGFLESEMDFLIANVQALLQAELQRSFRCVHLLTDYYNLLDKKDFIDIPEYYSNGFSNNYEALALEAAAVPNEDPLTITSFPRLERIFSDVMRVFAGEEEETIAQQANTGAKKAPGKGNVNVSPKKEDPRKKKVAGKEVVEEEKKEETKWEIELKKAINTEKAIFRYRVQVIKSMTLSKLNELKIQGKVLGNKLEDWVQYTHKIENEAVNDAMKMLRGFIEREEKIQKEIQFDYVKVITSYKTLNFFTPAPIILPAKEVLSPTRFSISQLYSLINELKTIGNSNFSIEAKTLLQYFSRKTANTMSEFSLPQSWKTHSFKSYQNMIQILDPTSQGLVDGKAFCVYLCLLNSKIMDREEEEAYLEEIKHYSQGNLIDFNGFLSCPCWFDEFEGGINEENSHYFNREKHVKSIIFSILCQENGTLNIGYLIKVLSLSEFPADFLKDEKTYYDFLFREKPIN